MPRLSLFALLLIAAPLQAAADVTVTHQIEGRFGVSYATGPDGRSQAQPLYEGRYTTTFAHDFDNGLTFRFELGVALGNFDPDTRGPRYPLPRSNPVGTN